MVFLDLKLKFVGINLGHYYGAWESLLNGGKWKSLP